MSGVRRLVLSLVAVVLGAVVLAAALLRPPSVPRSTIPPGDDTNA